MQNQGPVWKSEEMGVETKIIAYEAKVLSVLLYNSETWTLTETTKKKLLVFEFSCLRIIKGVTRKDRIKSADIRTELRVNTDVVQRLQRKRLSYFGHVNRMATYKLSYIAIWKSTRRKTKRPPKKEIDRH